MAALESVMDPEIGLSVTDLGLIYKIQFDEPGKKIQVDMTLTTRFCPMGDSIVNAVQRALEQTFIGEEVIIELVFEPPWNHERISEEGKIFLNR